MYLCKLHLCTPTMPKRLAILVLLIPSLFVEAQSIRLTNRQAPTALYLDTEHLYNFNLYERSRFEAAFTWVVPNESMPPEKYFLGQWFFRPYVAYSTGDKDFKYGFSAILRLPPRQDYKTRLFLHALVGVNLFNDLERAASRTLDSYSLLTPSINTGYVSSRYVGVRGGMLSLSAVPSPSFSYNISFRQTWEDYRFDAQGILYPSQSAQLQTEVKCFSEISSRLTWQQRFTADIHAGLMTDTAQHHYLKGLFQYATPYRRTGLAVFAQLGIATQGAPYSRMFDLSGTSNAWYFFRNSFFTVAPNTFTANLFTHLCLTYTMPKALWNRSWTSPHLFFQVNALWGYLFGQDGNGYRLWDGLPLQAPNLGIAETATGINGLLRWDVLELGCSMAYRFCPTAASYHNKDLSNNFALTVVADIIIDENHN